MEKLIDDGVNDFYEVGPGRVLAGLMKRIDRKLPVKSINSLEVVQELGE
jgi:[acyl-carrier-protein] S-malonyltransferase